MTEQEKNVIDAMLNEGWSYAQIAHEMGLSRNTVASYCRRHLTVTGKQEKPGKVCAQCGRSIPFSRQIDMKRFCSYACRMAWWRAHPELLNRKAVYPATCQFCGAAFEAYGNNHRKYCSRGCYGKARSGRNEER